jgi:hypothetical protein
LERRVTLSLTTRRTEKSLRLKSIFTRAINPITPVQPCRKKYSASVVGQISEQNPPVSPEGGALRTSRTLRWDAVAAMRATDERA